ncbi:MAG: ROK family protein, partial [Anaerolineales bacterium]
MATDLDWLGLDLGGTYLKGARVSSEGRIGERIHEPIASGSAEALLAQIAAAVVALGGHARARALGVGLPGIVDRGKGCVFNAPALSALNGLPLAVEVARRTGLPTRIENDANAAALGESWLGGGRDAASLLLVTLGTGVGAGIVLEGRVWTGHSGYAGELGHIQVEADGVPCACGSWGCLETVAGARGWRRRAEQRLASRSSVLRGSELDPKTIVAAAQAGDAIALEIVDGAAAALGVGLAAVLNLLNLNRVVVGGGVAAAGSFLLDRIVEQTRRRSFPQ